MDVLDNEFARNPIRIWMIALLAAALTYVVLAVVRRTLTERLSHIARRTTTFLDDAALEVLKRTRGYFLVALAALIGIRFLDIPEVVRRWTTRGLVLVVLTQVGRWLTHVIAAWIDRFVEQRTLTGDVSSITTVRALGYAARALVWVLVVITALESVFSYDVSALVTGLGIAGVAVALAVQNVLGDLLAALSIMLDKPFVVGDFIIVGDFLGTVEKIGLKTTRLRSLSGEQLIFSNAELLKSTIRNYKRMYERRIVINFDVHLDTPRTTLETLPGVLRGIIEAQTPVRFDRSHVAGIHDRGFRLEAVYYVLNPDFAAHMDVQQRVILALLAHFETAGVRLARTLLEEKLLTP